MRLLGVNLSKIKFIKQKYIFLNGHKYVKHENIED